MCQRKHLVSCNVSEIFVPPNLISCHLCLRLVLTNEFVLFLYRLNLIHLTSIIWDLVFVYGSYLQMIYASFLSCSGPKITFLKSPSTPLLSVVKLAISTTPLPDYKDGQQTSYLSFFLHTYFLRTDFSPHRFGTKTV